MHSTHYINDYVGAEIIFTISPHGSLIYLTMHSTHINDYIGVEIILQYPPPWLTKLFIMHSTHINDYTSVEIILTILHPPPRSLTGIDLKTAYTTALPSVII